MRRTWSHEGKGRKLTEHFPQKGHRFARKELKTDRKLDRDLKIARHVYESICLYL